MRLVLDIGYDPMRLAWFTVEIWTDSAPFIVGAGLFGLYWELEIRDPQAIRERRN